jgi:hypothetical protein
MRTRRYKYHSIHRTRKVGEDCHVCGGPNRVGQAAIDREAVWHKIGPTLVGICGECLRERNPVVTRQGVVVKYRIQSGWKGNPIWDCDVTLTEVGGHYHTTPDAGEPPEIVKVPEGRGLAFICKGQTWPLDAREGQLIAIEYIDGVPLENRISEETARDLLD